MDHVNFNLTFTWTTTNNRGVSGNLKCGALSSITTLTVPWGAAFYVNVPSDCLAKLIKVENDLAHVAAPKLKIWKLCNPWQEKEVKRKGYLANPKRSKRPEEDPENEFEATMRLLAGLVEQENLVALPWASKEPRSVFMFR